MATKEKPRTPRHRKISVVEGENGNFGVVVVGGAFAVVRAVVVDPTPARSKTAPDRVSAREVITGIAEVSAAVVAVGSIVWVVRTVPAGVFAEGSGFVVSALVTPLFSDVFLVIVVVIVVEEHLTAQ